MQNKEVQSIVTIRFTGDHKAVASEAQKKKPENPDAVIAQNTVKVVRYDTEERAQCDSSCRK